MKRIYISVVIIALVLGASLFEIFYVGSKSDSYTDRIKSIDAVIMEGDRSSALEECKSLESDWNRDAGKIYTLLIHDYIDSIGISISQMRAHLENGNADMYFAESANAKKGLASIKGSEYPYFENIF